MTDRELLELAAKAAGIEWIAHTDLIDGSPALRTSVTVAPLGMWAPLTDDGDALRLAVKLGMELDLLTGEKKAATAYYEDATSGAWKVREPHGADPYAATRRAIVRAAAEIGRSAA